MSEGVLGAGSEEIQDVHCDCSEQSKVARMYLMDLTLALKV